MDSTIQIENLPEDLPRDALYSLFLPFGPIASIAATEKSSTEPASNQNNHSATRATIVYEARGDAAAAADNMDGAEVHGRALRVRVGGGPIGAVIDMKRSIWNQED